MGKWGGWALGGEIQIFMTGVKAWDGSLPGRLGQVWVWQVCARPTSASGQLSLIPSVSHSSSEGESLVSLLEQLPCSV